MEHLNMYTGNPTAGGYDGTVVSDMGTLTSPIAATLEKGATVVIPCAVRCVTGYYGIAHIAAATRQQDGTYTIGSDWIEVSEDGTNWTSMIDVEAEAYNTLFYVKLTAGQTAGRISDGALRCLAEVEQDDE